MNMRRREFVQRSASLAGGAAVLGLNPLAALANQPDANGTTASQGEPVRALLRDAPAPISENERAQRRDKAQRPSRCKSHPENAPAGSNRNSHGGDEMAETSGKRVTNW